MIYIDIITFLIGGLILIIAGSLLVKTLSKIAGFLHISEYVVGFILLAFATSVPELFVGIVSALEKNTALALGTVIGANIANLTFVIAIPILLAKGIKIESEKTTKDALYMIIAAILPLILMLIGNQISRIDGIILVSYFFIYGYKLYSERKEFRKPSNNKVKHWAVIVAVIIFMLSIGALFLSAQIIVKSATSLALTFAMPPILIGLFMISIGTSLPELTTGVTAVLKGHTQMSIGNVIGSVIANSALILGVTAIIYPITSDFLIFITSGVYMVLTAVIFTTFIKSEDKLDWAEGVSLLFIYLFFVMIELFIRGAI